MTFSPHDYGRQKFDFGMVDADLGPRIEPSVEWVMRELEAPSLRAQRALDVQSSWPEHRARVPRALHRERETSDALPRADCLVVNTVAEQPRMVITVGTAVAANPDHFLCDATRRTPRSIRLRRARRLSSTCKRTGWPRTTKRSVIGRASTALSLFGL